MAMCACTGTCSSRAVRDADEEEKRLGSTAARGAVLLGRRRRLLAAAAVRRELRLQQRNAGLLERPSDVIADPLPVPPFDRCHRHSADHHFVVEVVADGETRDAAPPELLPLLDLVA